MRSHCRAPALLLCQGGTRFEALVDRSDEQSFEAAECFAAALAFASLAFEVVACRGVVAGPLSGVEADPVPYPMLGVLGGVEARQSRRAPNRRSRPSLPPIPLLRANRVRDGSGDRRSFRVAGRRSLGRAELPLNRLEIEYPDAVWPVLVAFGPLRETVCVVGPNLASALSTQQ